MPWAQVPTSSPVIGQPKALPAIWPDHGSPALGRIPEVRNSFLAQTVEWPRVPESGHRWRVHEIGVYVRDGAGVFRGSPQRVRQGENERSSHQAIPFRIAM